MKLKRQSRQAPRPELNIAAMIDIVFQLLIFFMCTTSFKTNEEALQAQARQLSRKAREAQDLVPVRVQVSPADTDVLIECDGLVCRGFPDLLQRLKARRAIADVPVIITGGSRTGFRHMVTALDTCYEAGLTNVAFSTKGVK